MDNINTWTGPSVVESIRMIDKWTNGESMSMVWPTLGSRTAKKQNRVLPAHNGVNLSRQSFVGSRKYEASE